jgi:hypothetical protein
MIVHEPGQASQIDGERDKVLLYAIVERALDRAPIGVRGLDQALPRPMKLGHFALQSVDSLTELLARASVRHRPTFPGRSAVNAPTLPRRDGRITLSPGSSATAASPASIGIRTRIGFEHLWQPRADCIRRHVLAAHPPVLDAAAG